MVSAEESSGNPEQAVVAYLRLHPDFFRRRPELLEGLSIPHPCQPAVSLLEYQNRLLRERSQRLHAKLLELVAIARDNDRLSERVQRLALTLLEMHGGLDELLDSVKAALRDDFNADCVSLHLAISSGIGLKTATEFLHPEVIALFERVFQAGQPQCGRLRLERATALFGDSAPQVASAALIPLGGGEWRGLLALGSWDAERFDSGVGTLFLRRVGELISQALQVHLTVSNRLTPPDPRSMRTASREEP